MKTMLLVLSGLLVTGCASEKVLSPVESVQGAQDSVDKTNEYITKAEGTITAFEKDLQGLMKDASKSDKMRGKEKFNEALTVMDRRIAESRRELAHLKATNIQSWEAYKGRIDNAREDMSTEFKENSK